MSITTTSGPKCPNHLEPLKNIPFPIPQKGTGICPVSKCSFDYEIELDQQVNKLDKFGNLIKSYHWNTSGDEK